jgi:putative ABC transport system substrate-binding protein
MIGLYLLAPVLLSIDPLAASAAEKIYRVGYLWTSQREHNPFSDAFESGLKDRGYKLGKDLRIEYRFADGKFDRLPALAAELVRLKPDALVTSTNVAILAVQKETRTVPIVMAFGNDPISSGLITSLSHPEGNLTGFTIDTGDEFLGKRLDVLKEALPALSRLAVLFNSANPAHDLYVKHLERPAQNLGLTLLPVAYRQTTDFENAFKTMAAQRADAMFLFSDGVSFVQKAAIAGLAAKIRLPSAYPAREYVEVGGLISYGPILIDNMRRAADYVDKILKGAKPADLPVEQPTKFELVINLKTAKQIGLTIPPNVLARADRVIK